jgi:hypothetical protein
MRLEPPNEYTHVVLPPLDEPASQSATGGGSIRAVYKNGIEFIDQMGSIDGYLAAWMGTAALIALSLLVWSLTSYTSIILLHIVPALVFLGCLTLGRSDSVGYRYQPVLFDRAAQKVHVFTDLGSTWWHVWKLYGATPFRVDSYDWKCARGEVAEIAVLGGAGLPRTEYALTLAITDVPGGCNVVARFGVGFTMGYDGGATQINRWEHIRRYMSGKGPALASRDELYRDESMGHWLGAFTFAQPLLGPGSKVYWTGEAFYGAWFLTIPVGMFMLVTLLPLTVPASLFRWFAHKGKGIPRWPAEIQASIGEEVDPSSLERKPNFAYAAGNYSKPIPTFTLKERMQAKRRKRKSV